MGSDSDLADMFKKAAQIASVVPQSMQEAAFHRALDALQGESSSSKPQRPQSGSGGRPKRGSGGASSDSSADPVAQLQQLSRMDAAEVDEQDGALGKSLALLRVAERELSIERLSAPQIAAVLTDKFRWKVSRRGVGKALDSAGKLVDRRKESGAVSYRLMAPGEEWLDDPAGRQSATQPRGSGRATARKKAAAPTKRPVKKAAASARADAGTPAPKPRRSSTRTGPKAAVEQLIGEGYFATPRTIGDIRLHLEQTRALRFDGTDMGPTMVRLLRGGQLGRAKNADGQYEYSASGS